jgi:hypothetical protein
MDRTGVILIVLGLALAFVSGFADSIGLGDERGFHYRQGIGVGVGALLVIVGVVAGIRRARGAGGQPPAETGQP